MDTERDIEPDQAWLDAGWGDAWHPQGTDVWDFISEVLNDALDYLDDQGYL